MTISEQDTSWDTRWRAAVTRAQEEPSQEHFDDLDQLRREHITGITDPPRLMMRGFISSRGPGGASVEDIEDALEFYGYEPDAVSGRMIRRWLREDHGAGLIERAPVLHGQPGIMWRAATAKPAELPRRESPDDSAWLQPGEQEHLTQWLLEHRGGTPAALHLHDVKVEASPGGLRIRLGRTGRPSELNGLSAIALQAMDRHEGGTVTESALNLLMNQDPRKAAISRQFSDQALVSLRRAGLVAHLHDDVWSVTDEGREAAARFRS